MMFDINNSPIFQIVFACKVSNNYEDAKTFLHIASTYAGSIAQLDEIAYLQMEIKDYQGSVQTLKKCLERSYHPREQYAIRSNLAKVYNHLNEPAFSIENSNLNLRIDPNNFDTKLELAFSYYLKGDYQTSEQMMREIARTNNVPDNVMGRVLYNLGSYDIEKGLFKEGLRGFIEIGHKIGIWKHTEIPEIPVWDGSVHKDKIVYIHAEGGIGDEIINVRFMKNIVEMGMKPIWLTTNEHVKEVFVRNGFDCMTPNDIISPNKDTCVQIQAMFLPIVLDLPEDKLWTGSYLKPSTEYVQKWKEKLPTNKLLGVKWSGNPAYDQDLHRSIPIDEIKRLRFDGTKVNLQLEEELEIADFYNIGREINSIEDTLAVLWLCDEVVTSCTSIAHMASAMGISCIVCPPIASYYVWLGMDGEKSNWYGATTKVVRQKDFKDWTKVIDRAQEILNDNKLQQ